MRTLSVCIATLTLCPGALAARQAGEAVVTGRVEGTVVLSARLASRKPRVRLDGVYGAPVAPRRPVNERLNVVVYLQSVPSPQLPRTSPPLAVRQVQEAFVPHVLPVLVGDSVSFPNEDPFFHNVFSLSKARSFDLGRYPTGVSKSVRFDRPGVVQVFCHIHSDMRATVLVLENPFFTTADSTGRFILPPVPPGAYQLVVWHERIEPAVKKVTVRSGETTTAHFEIPLPPDAANP